MDQKGGVIAVHKKWRSLKDFSRHCFKTFLDHSTVSYLSNGRYGIAFILKINNLSKSPYIDIDGKQVKVLIVKIGVLAPVEKSYAILKPNKDVTSMTPEDFKEEHGAQEAIFRKSLEHYNSALCPAIVYIDSLAWGDLKMYPKLHMFFKNEPFPIRLSFIGMETFDHVDTLHRIGSTPAMESLCFYFLLKLGALGYAHGDPSLSNIIVDTKKGRPFLIDFGNVKVLSSQDTKFLRTQLVGITDFRRVLAILLKGFPLEHPEMSNWDWIKYMTTAPKTSRSVFALFRDARWREVL